MNRRVKIGLIVLSYVAMAVSGILYTNWVDRRSNQQWCAIINTSDEVYKQHPPQTEPDQRIAKEMHELRIRFECDN